VLAMTASIKARRSAEPFGGLVMAIFLWQIPANADNLGFSPP